MDGLLESIFQNKKCTLFFILPICFGMLASTAGAATPSGYQSTPILATLLRVNTVYCIIAVKINPAIKSHKRQTSHIQFKIRWNCTQRQIFGSRVFVRNQFIVDCRFACQGSLHSVYSVTSSTRATIVHCHNWTCHLSLIVWFGPWLMPSTCQSWERQVKACGMSFIPTLNIQFKAFALWITRQEAMVRILNRTMCGI